MSTDWERTRRPLKRVTSPAWPGNDLAVKHGADSSRLVEARAGELRVDVLRMAPWLDRPEYAVAVHRFLRAESRALMLHEHIERTVASAGAGKVAARVWEQATAADRLAAQLGNVLGLDPLGLARLRSATAESITAEQSLADLAAEGRQIRLRRQAELDAAAATAAGAGGEAPASASQPLNGADGEEVPE